MTHLIQFCRTYKCFKVVGITTNGEQIAKDPNRFMKIVEDSTGAVELTFQVSADKRYYPRRVEPHKRVFHQKGFVFMQVSTGVLDYNTAIRRAIRSVAQMGVSTTINDAVGYDSGYHLSVRSAARMCVLTGVNQMAGQMNDLVCDE